MAALNKTATSIEEAKELLTSLFEKNDVVLLGEAHGIAENLQLVQEMIEWLPTIGVNRLAVEFGAEEFQNEADLLVSAPEFNRQTARDLLFHYNAGWPYVDYQDLYLAAWKVNQQSSADFRIIHSSYVFDWSQWSGTRDAETMNRVFSRGYFNEFRAQRILEQVKAGHKVLGLYGGFHVMKCDEFPFSVDWLDRKRPALGQILSDSIPIATVGLHPEEKHASVWQAPGAFDAFIALSDNLTPCEIDQHFLDGKDFDDVIESWPDPDWTPPPKNVEDYWRIIRERDLA